MRYANSTLLSAAAIVIATTGAPGSTMAADPEAGALLAAQCAACHGGAGVSTDEKYPNLAAQSAPYIEKQLKAFRAGDRTDPLMNAIADGLSDDDIANLAAHFAGLPGAEPGARGGNETALDGSAVAFPADYSDSFKRYHRIDFEDRKQVRFYRANQAAIEGAQGGTLEGAFILVEVFGAKADADGNLVKEADGSLVPDGLKAFTAMELRAGNGAAVPEILRNGDWRYAVFSAEGQPRDGLNEGPCLACHKPEARRDYVFTLDELKAFAEAQ